MSLKTTKVKTLTDNHTMDDRNQQGYHAETPILFEAHL